MVFVAFSHLSDTFVADLPQLCTSAITVQIGESTIQHMIDLLPMNLLEAVDGADSGLTNMPCIPVQENGGEARVAAAPSANVTHMSLW